MTRDEVGNSIFESVMDLLSSEEYGYCNDCPEMRYIEDCGCYDCPYSMDISVCEYSPCALIEDDIDKLLLSVEACQP